MSTTTVPQDAGRLARRGWTLGPNHPDYNRAEYGPGPIDGPRLAYHCRACGAPKKGGRSLCPCGAFRRPER